MEDPKSEKSRVTVFRWPVYWLTLVGHWHRQPHSRLAYFFSRVVWPVGWTYIAVHIILYLILDEYPLIDFLHSFCDLFIIFVMVAKMATLNRHGKKLFEIRRFIEEAFTPYESEAGVEATARRLNEACARTADTTCTTVFWAYVVLASASATVSFGSVLGPREERVFWFKIPSGWQEIDVVYWLLFFFMYPFNYSIFNIFPSSFDMLFASISLHISCKATILQALLNNAKSKAQSTLTSRHGGETQEESDERGDSISFDLEKCAKYHQLIIRLWSESENVLSGGALVQVMYNLTVVGVPLVRFLFEDLALHEIVFVGLYTSFNLAQLFMFCWFGDMVADSTSKLSFVVYGVYAPNIRVSSKSRSILNMMMLRSQRPLYFTVYKLSKLTVELYIDIMKRSQCFYSAILSTR